MLLYNATTNTIILITRMIGRPRCTAPRCTAHTHITKAHDSESGQSFHVILFRSTLQSVATINITFSSSKCKQQVNIVI